MHWAGRCSPLSSVYYKYIISILCQSNILFLTVFYLFILESNEIERNLHSGNILSNRIYLWRLRGFDPAMKKQYSENFTVMNNRKVSIVGNTFSHCYSYFFIWFNLNTVIQDSIIAHNILTANMHMHCKDYLHSRKGKKAVVI